MESMGLVLTSRDKARIYEPFAFGQNNMLSKTCVCASHGHHALSLGSVTSAYVDLKGTGRHMDLEVRQMPEGCQSGLAARRT